MREPFLQKLEALKDLSPHQIRKRYGGKALGLFEAHQLGLKIPETWVIGTSHFEEYHSGTLSEIEKEIALLPDTLFAVRSSSQMEDSSSHSFAGIFETLLNVKKSELRGAILRVWDSCSSMRASSYLKEAQKLSMGVILQPMVHAKMAGVAFSKHPSPENVFENHNIVVEFAHAAGEAVVQGQITPVRLEGNEESLSQVTDYQWFKSLLDAILKLKNFHNFEVDCEFVVSHDDEFVLVQQRPVSRTHSSHILDLTDYERKYKRSLFTLDIELLIGGCATALSAYLDLPYQMERWMVMTSNQDGSRELWVHRLLDEACVHALGGRFERESDFITLVEKKYSHEFQKVLKYDYTLFSHGKKELKDRFGLWVEFMRPLHAHYYVPIFMIEALHLLLLKEFKKIDPKQGEEDLFFLGTFDISTLMDLLHEKLREVKEGRETVAGVWKRFSFLKCRKVDEEGYSEEELLTMMHELPEKETPKVAEEKKWYDLFAKYVRTPHLVILFEKFREWMRIRNQEMEYLMYAVHNSRFLFSELATMFGCTPSEVWNSSSELIRKGLEKRPPRLMKGFEQETVAIYHSFGKTRLNSDVKVIQHQIHEGLLSGKKVFGEGKIECVVKVAFSPKELENLEAFDRPCVLVTGMTTPDFIPYLRKYFSALITDEGGILCHAAIVAREIALPCLVGTGKATDVLKDGMMVILDLDRGEITPERAFSKI